MCKHCWDDEPGEHHKDFIRGGVKIEDFDDEPMRERTAGKSRRKARVRKTPSGCPGNDFKAHVYIWTTEQNEEDSFFKFYGYHRFEKKVCCGCEKKTYGRRSTPRYDRWKKREWERRFGGEFNVPRGEPVVKYRRGSSYNYFAPERDDPKFMEFHRQRMQRLGAPTWYSSW